jgi:hypothetical protein
MTELPAYPAHFDFGRLFADIGQVLTRGWLPLAIGVAVLGAAPAAVTSMPWWQGPVAGGPFLRVWVEVTMLKAAINLVSLSAAVTLMACVSLNVLTAATGLEWRALVGGSSPPSAWVCSPTGPLCWPRFPPSIRESLV